MPQKNVSDPVEELDYITPLYLISTYTCSFIAFRKDSVASSVISSSKPAR